MKLEKLLIGFDAREMWFSFDNVWSGTRKNTFLLRHDIYKPLSVDRDIWNSIFELDYAQEVPLWRGPVQKLWDSLEELEKYTANMKSTISGSYWIVAITKLVGVQEKEELQQLYDINPDRVNEKWLLLGYDVCNSSFLSGLSNCGYRHDEIDLAIQKWRDSLNKYHLLETLEDALEFQKWTEKRVIAHGPFFVYGLHLIEKVNIMKYA